RRRRIAASPRFSPSFGHVKVGLATGPEGRFPRRNRPVAIRLSTCAWASSLFSIAVFLHWLRVVLVVVVTAPAAVLSGTGSFAERLAGLVNHLVLIVVVEEVERRPPHQLLRDVAVAPAVVVVGESDLVLRLGHLLTGTRRQLLKRGAAWLGYPGGRRRQRRDHVAGDTVADLNGGTLRLDLELGCVGAHQRTQQHVVAAARRLQVRRQVPVARVSEAHRLYPRHIHRPLSELSDGVVPLVVAVFHGLHPLLRVQ